MLNVWIYYIFIKSQLLEQCLLNIYYELTHNNLWITQLDYFKGSAHGEIQRLFVGYSEFKSGYIIKIYLSVKSLCIEPCVAVSPCLAVSPCVTVSLCRPVSLSVKVDVFWKYHLCCHVVNKCGQNIRLIIFKCLDKLISILKLCIIIFVFLIH